MTVQQKAAAEVGQYALSPQQSRYDDVISRLSELDAPHYREWKVCFQSRYQQVRTDFGADEADKRIAWPALHYLMAEEIRSDLEARL